MKTKNKFQDIINIISNVMEAYTTALFLADDKKEFMELYCYQSFCKNIDKRCVIKDGEGLIGWVLREKKNVLAANFERNTQTLIFYKEDEKIKSLMAMPLPEGFGVLFVDSKKSYRFTEEKEKIFKQFSEHIYNCLCDQKERNAYQINSGYYNFFVKFEKKRKDQLDLEEVSALLFENINLSQFFFVVPQKCVFVCFYDEEKKRNISFHYLSSSYKDDGLLGWCVKNRKKLVNNDVKTRKTFILNGEDNRDINNFVGIPVYEKNWEDIGAVGFVKKRENENFMSEKIYWNKNEIDFLEIFGLKLFEAYMIEEMRIKK